MQDKEKNLFNRIAPIYGLFFKYQTKYYNNVLDIIKNSFDIFSYESILDVGCGTGALCNVLNKRGFIVSGMDGADKMIKVAKKNLSNNEVELVCGSALERIPFDDHSFDIAISSYVLHGMEYNKRKIVYGEMSRVAKCKVIYHDYNEERSLITDITERLEGGDYFNFIKNAKAEMEESFKDVQVINVGPRAAWYICTP